MKKLLLTIVPAMAWFGNAMAQFTTQSTLPQGTNDISCEYFSIPEASFNKTAMAGYSPNGEVFTPKGDLKVLIIFAGFDPNLATGFDETDGTTVSDFGDWSISAANGGHGSLPNFVDANTGGMDDLIYDTNSDFTTVPSTNPNNKSLSRFFMKCRKVHFV